MPATLPNICSGCLSDSRALCFGARPALAGAVPGVDNGGMARPKLTDDEVRDGLARLPGWAREGDEIVKVYELPTFMGGDRLRRPDRRAGRGRQPPPRPRHPLPQAAASR